MKTSLGLSSKDVQEITETAGVSGTLLVGRLRNYARAAEVAQSRLAKLKPDRAELLAPALSEIGDIARLRVLTFALGLAQDAEKLRVRLRLLETDYRTAERNAANLRAQMRTNYKAIEAHIQNLEAADPAAFAMLAEYDFKAKEHLGPELRAWLRLSERGFRNLCRRAGARGRKRRGKATKFTQSDLLKILRARLAAMGPKRRKDFLEINFPVLARPNPTKAPLLGSYTPALLKS